MSESCACRLASLTERHVPVSLRRSVRQFRSRRAAREIGHQLGHQIGRQAALRADSQQQGFLGTKMERDRAKWPLSCGFVPCLALRRAGFGARFQAHNREFQAFDLRKRGAPKGIRICAPACRGFRGGSCGCGIAAGQRLFPCRRVPAVRCRFELFRGRMASEWRVWTGDGGHVSWCSRLQAWRQPLEVVCYPRITSATIAHSASGCWGEPSVSARIEGPCGSRIRQRARAA